MAVNDMVSSFPKEEVALCRKAGKGKRVLAHYRGTWVLWCSQKAAVFGVLSWHSKDHVQCAGFLCILAMANRISDCVSKCLQLWVV